jgi:hypothetical protein
MKWTQYHNKRNGRLFSHEIHLEKINFRYFAFSPNSEKPMKAIIRHLPPEMSTEDISNNLRT